MLSFVYSRWTSVLQNITEVRLGRHFSVRGEARRRRAWLPEVLVECITFVRSYSGQLLKLHVVGKKTRKFHV